jgi:hypothetical protein
MPIPSHTERPDLYDGYDCQSSSPNTIENMLKNMPDHVKMAIAERQAAMKDAEPPTRAEE